jgi:putative PIN family toxin of toxin-antitoxin system
LRAVLDTNVLISAFLFPGGAPEMVYRLVLQGQVEFIISRALLAEFGRVLTAKFRWDVARAEAAVAQLISIGIMVEPLETVTEISADPTDDRVLEAAASGGAQVIVSGDRHLLSLGTWHGIRILPPAAFLQEFR